jgi:hypothetical protein
MAKSRPVGKDKSTKNYPVQDRETGWSGHNKIWIYIFKFCEMITKYELSLTFLQKDWKFNIFTKKKFPSKPNIYW